MTEQEIRALIREEIVLFHRLQSHLVNLRQRVGDVYSEDIDALFAAEQHFRQLYEPAEIETLRPQHQRLPKGL